MNVGVYKSKLKNGTEYYRASFTYKNRHISLGSFNNEVSANLAYREAKKLISGNDDFHSHSDYPDIPFDKFISLINFRDNNLYIKNPIYMYKTFFNYFLSPDKVMTFDIDDLFYYSNHKIQTRGGRLFCADFGMQITLQSRYGIKNYAVKGRDYVFLNGDELDFRYENLKILNRYTGVRYEENSKLYKACIIINGETIIGRYSTEEEAAIAYNKAVDYLKSIGSTKNYSTNYIEHIGAKKYADIYSSIDISTFCNKIN